jgi:hypothetical protein
LEDGSCSSDAYTDSEDGDVDKEYSTDNDVDGSYDSGEDNIEEDMEDDTEYSSGGSECDDKVLQLVIILISGITDKALCMLCLKGLAMRGFPFCSSL